MSVPWKIGNMLSSFEGKGNYADKSDKMLMCVVSILQYNTFYPPIRVYLFYFIFIATYKNLPFLLGWSYLYFRALVYVLVFIASKARLICVLHIIILYK